MNEIALPNRNKDITAWSEQDAQKAAQVGTSVGKAIVDIAKRAKDIHMLEVAVAEQIHAQADFVEWWDRQEKGQGERTDLQHRNSTVTKLDDYGLSKMTVSRWRKKLTTNGKRDPEKIEAAIAEAVAKFAKFLMPDDDATVENHRAIGTGENEWYTPQQYIDLARCVMGNIDLDPATSELANQRVMAAEFFTSNDNGLEKEWHGNVWMNPPYSQPLIAQFCERLAQQYFVGNVQQAIALTHNYTDTGWFHGLAEFASAICFTRGRIAFENPKGEKASPTQGQAFFYLGPNPDNFMAAFSAIGFVMKRNLDA